MPMVHIYSAAGIHFHAYKFIPQVARYKSNGSQSISSYAPWSSVLIAFIPLPKGDISVGESSSDSKDDPLVKMLSIVKVSSSPPKLDRIIIYIYYNIISFLKLIRYQNTK